VIVTVLYLWGALSDEKTGLSFVRVVVCSNKPNNNVKIFTNLHVMHGNNVHTICTGPLSVQSQYSRLYPMSTEVLYQVLSCTLTKKSHRHIFVIGFYSSYLIGQNLTKDKVESFCSRCHCIRFSNGGTNGVS
jgi:hypothetical protein